MTPAFSVCVVGSNAQWWLKDYGNDADVPHFDWTIEPDRAHRFTRYGEAIELMQMVKHTHPEAHVRLMEFPQNKVQHDTDPA